MSNVEVEQSGRDVTAYRDLKDLCEKGLLVRRGRGRGTYYALIEMKGL